MKRILILDDDNHSPQVVIEGITERPVSLERALFLMAMPHEREYQIKKVFYIDLEDVELETCFDMVSYHGYKGYEEEFNELWKWEG